MNSLQTIKQRFGIIGNNNALNRALERSILVAPTEMTILVIGESGVGKEFIPKIIHQLSARKHSPYIAVNCGAIPEGTIDSELFGHEKGSFTGADKSRKGYFEEANGGTIFLDEVGELPLQTQVRLLRVLENGEFMKVGSSKIQKISVRVVAATNVNIIDAVKKGKFREDLYYRLNTMQIDLPPLRERKEDIPLLFKKFSSVFAEKYHMPITTLSEDSLYYLSDYYWPGNIRQLRNFAEKLTIVEQKKVVNLSTLKEYLPPYINSITKTNQNGGNDSFSDEREILYKFLIDMKKDLNDLRELTSILIKQGSNDLGKKGTELATKVFSGMTHDFDSKANTITYDKQESEEKYNAKISNEEEDLLEYIEYEQEQNYSLHTHEIELIKKALEKYNGKRKYAAKELGISERTLYRKIKQFDIL